MIRLGLCCSFKQEPIRFRTTTAGSILKLSRQHQLARLQALALANAESLLQSLHYCFAHGIGCFRVNSQILPLRTHPEAGWSVRDLPASRKVVAAFRRCGNFAKDKNLRMTFHPDQFVVLNSPNPKIVESSIAELVYQAEVARWVGADVIIIHGGGSYGDRPSALNRLQHVLQRLPRNVLSRLALENDDRVFSPRDLHPVCRAARIPLVYDVHHHRCHPDGFSECDTTELAMATWDREPLFHISSPLAGWTSSQPRKHAEYIDPRDFPSAWTTKNMTVEVEAKSKELAVARLRRALALG